jgi:hypothetical protein
MGYWPRPPKPPVDHRLPVHVDVPVENAGADTVVSLTTWDPPILRCAGVQQPNTNIWRITVPGRYQLTGAWLDVTSSGRKPVHQRFVIPNRDVQTPTVSLQLNLQGSETAALRRINGKLVEDGKTDRWRCRGIDAFRLYEQWLNHVNIDAWLDDVYTKPDGTPYPPEQGPNWFRVFGCYQVDSGGNGIGTLRPQDYGDTYFEQLQPFLQHMAVRGWRVEFTFGDWSRVEPDVMARRAFYERFAATVAGNWNVTVEACNEPMLQGNLPEGSDEAYRLGQIVASHGILCSSGSYEDWPPTRVLQYGTNHSERKDEWPRTPKDSRDRELANDCIWIEDEGTGAAEAPRGDSRSTDANDFAWYGATAALECSGATFHCDDGQQCVPLGPTQRICLEAFLFGLNFPPANAPDWPYQRGVQGDPTGYDMPVLHDDNLELRSFAKANGGQAWSIQIRTQREEPTAVNGWQTKAIPRKGFVYSER